MGLAVTTLLFGALEKLQTSKGIPKSTTLKI